MLAMLKVVGEIEHGATTWMPSLQLSYTTDDQKAYRDSLDNLVPKQGVALGQLALGLDFSHDVAVRTATPSLELTGGIAAILSSIQRLWKCGACSAGIRGRSRKSHAWRELYDGERRQTSVSAFYDGIGVSEFESFGVEARIRLSF